MYNFLLFDTFQQTKRILDAGISVYCYFLGSIYIIHYGIPDEGNPSICRFHGSITAVVVIAVALTMAGAIDPVKIASQYTSRQSTLETVELVSNMFAYPCGLTICILIVLLAILATVYYQMFKKINIKILYATIALAFAINLLIDGVVMRGIRQGAPPVRLPSRFRKNIRWTT